MSTTPAEASQQPVMRQAVTGVVPPKHREASIRTVWPSVIATSAPIAKLASLLTRTIILAPLAWLLLAPLFVIKIGPIFSKRYTLTNRRILVRRGLSGKIKREVALADIDEIRLGADSYNAFYHCATLEIYSQGDKVLSLKGVKEPQSFRQSILSAMIAWVPAKAKLLPMKAASED